MKQLLENGLNEAMGNGKCGKNLSYYVSLTSRYMCESLSNLWDCTSKNETEIFPDNIPKVYF